MTKLFVAGYPLDIQEIELIELFSVQGMIHSIHLITDKVTRKHKGYGFIEMLDKEGADRAVAFLNGTVLRGRKINIKLAEENRAEKPRTFKSNRFPGLNESGNESFDVKLKMKRPRKLISDVQMKGK